MAGLKTVMALRNLLQSECRAEVSCRRQGGGIREDLLLPGMLCQPVHCQECQHEKAPTKRI
ncbi:uncharacterized protein LOC143032902 isoform X3 [Oratosquilla oratoria]|uniref:uncharacterized protein LOC143032902 isoform X3 n=1 Tax=Oratosquilla oratoria TaxID=337810 RepID=UPI003F7696B8